MRLVPLLALALLVQSAPKAADQGTSYGLFLEALALRDAGKSEDAVKALQKTLKADPLAADAYAEIARIQMDEGRFDLALAAVGQAVRMAPKRPDLRSLAGQVHQFFGQSGGGEQELKLAVIEYEAAARLRPGDPGPLRDLTRLYSALRDAKASLDVWKRLAGVDPQNIDAFVQVATLSLAMGDSSGAIEALQTAAKAEPQNTRVLQLLGDINRQANKPDEALQNYAAAAKAEPKDLISRLKMGEILIEAHKGNDALAVAEEMLSQDDHNRFALDLKVRALKELGRTEEALQIALGLSSSEPKDLKAAFLVVTLLEQKGALPDAEERLGQLTRRNTSGEDAESVGRNNRVFWAHLGLVQQRQGKFKAAALSFGEAVRAAKEPDPSLVTYRIDALISAKDWSAALQESRAARADPIFKDETDLKFLEAYALRGMDDEKAATALVEGLIGRAKASASEVLAGADFFQRGKNFGRARELFADVAAKEPQNLRAVFGLAAVLERLKKHDEADAAFRRAIALAPESAVALNYLGYMNADRNVKVEEALTLIQKAVSTDPDNGSYLDSLAWALYRLGRHAEAETAVRQAIKSQENNAVVVSHLGFILAARGQAEEAAKYLRLSLTGEDEDGELDRPKVEEKLRELSKAEAKRN